MVALIMAESIISAQAKITTFEQKIPNSLVKFHMAKLPPGSIVIGGKTYTLKEFAIGTTEVTWDLYDIYAFRLDQSAEDQAKGVDAKSRPSRPYGAPDRGFGHAGYAALGMTDHAAAEFCKWLSKKTGRKYRLPTEAEWEYAARAGAQNPPTPLADYAWFWDNADDMTHPVGTKKPNAWGLFDMLGNTAEWALDMKGKPVVCGGSFMSKAAGTAFGARQYYDPKWQEADAHVPKSKWWLSDGPMIGMRVVCDLP